MSNIITFDYEGHEIVFEFQDGQRMMNATSMAKPFGKRVNDFLRLKQTKTFVAALEARYGNPRNGNDHNIKKPVKEVIRVAQGGKPELQGTWMDEKLGLKFAAWLDVNFELFVFDCVYELLTKGKAEIQRSDTPLLEEIRSVMNRIDRQGIQQEFMQEQIEDVFDRLDNDESRLDEIEAKIRAGESSQMSIVEYCRRNGIDCPLEQAKKWGRAASKLSRERGVLMGKVYDERFGDVRSYEVEILKEVIQKN